MKKLLLTSVLLCSVLFAVFSQVKAEPNPDFDPNFSAVMPVIKITSETGNNDFVTKPVAKHVTEQRKTWGDIRNDPAPYYENCKVTVINGDSQAELDAAEAKVKVRGNWTTDYPKKSLRIRFSEKQPLLGMNEGRKNKDWVLLNTYKDWSFMRDATGLYLGKMICPGYTSDFKLAEVYINGEYWGVYVVAELQEVCKDRVDITEPKKDYKGTDIGYFVEYDSYYFAEKNSFTFKSSGSLKDIKGKSVSVPPDAGYAIKNEINSEEQKAFIAKYVENVWKICYEAVYKKKFLEFDSDYKSLVKSDASNAYDCVSKVIDLDSMVAAYILAEVTCDPSPRPQESGRDLLEEALRPRHAVPPRFPAHPVSFRRGAVPLSRLRETAVRRYAGDVLCGVSGVAPLHRSTVLPGLRRSDGRHPGCLPEMPAPAASPVERGVLAFPHGGKCTSGDHDAEIPEPPGVRAFARQAARDQAEARAVVSRRYGRPRPAALDQVRSARLQSGRPDLPGYFRGTWHSGGPGAPPCQADPSAGASDPKGKNFEFSGSFFSDGFDKMRKACYINCRRCSDDGHYACHGGVCPA